MNRRAFFGVMAGGAGVVAAGRRYGMTGSVGTSRKGYLYVAPDGGWGVPVGEDMSRYVRDINFVEMPDEGFDTATITITFPKMTPHA